MVLKKLILSFLLSIPSCFSIEQSQFDILYSSDHRLPEIENWKAKTVLDSCKLPYNRMAFCSLKGEVCILESGLMDSFFTQARSQIKSPDFIRKFGTYDLSPQNNIITMIDLLFLRLPRNITWISNKAIREITSSKYLAQLQSFYENCYLPSDEYTIKKQLRLSFELSIDLHDMYNFQAAMISVATKNLIDLRKNIGSYIKSSNKFLKRLQTYISACPQINLSSPRDRHSLKSEAIDVLNKLEDSIVVYNTHKEEQLALAIINAIAYITHDYPVQPGEHIINESLKISKTGRRTDDTSLAIKNTKRYLAAISHTEVMYYILKNFNKLSNSDGKIIVSGKCPCSDCDVFITDESIKHIFSETKMIGYAYGWMSQEPIIEKESYKLVCKQIFPPKKIQLDNSLSDIRNPHISHIGTTPLNQDSVISDTLKTFVIGPIYSDPDIISSECLSPEDSTGKCIIRNSDKSKQSGYQNPTLNFNMLE